MKRTYEASILADAPRIGASGSFALSSVRYGPGFAALIAELKGEAFRRVVESKLGIDLHHYPTMITVRGFAIANAMVTDTSTPTPGRNSSLCCST